MILHSRVAIVTGGTKGIGRAIAEALCREGVNTMICARHTDEVEDAVAEMGRLHGERVSGVKCDVRAYDEVKTLVRATVDEFGGVDILVNNAGVGILGSVNQLTPDAWHEVIDTNLTGVFYCCREVIPEMQRRGEGYIINISSRAGINAFAGGAAYNASKFGIIGFSEALLLDLRYDHIRVSYIMPGRVSTNFAGEKPQPWHVAPEDIAKTVVDLLKLNPRAVASRVEIRPAEPQS